MDTLGKRLTHIINSLNTSKFAFSKKINAAQAFVSNICGDKQEISRGLIEKILDKYPNVNITWLFTGHGQPFLLPSESTEFREPIAQYIKSPKSEIHQISEETELKGIFSDNLKAIVQRWDMYNHELFALLDPEIGRQGISKYMLGQSYPSIAALIRLEYVTGIALVDLLTRRIDAAEIPAGPISPGELLPLLNARLRSAHTSLEAYFKGE